jgi:5-methyltetrahydrofolate--homocysteine methyltransferase
MHNTLDKLLARTPVITDGAWGTQLQERGLPLGACPDGWNLEQPAKVEEVARAYVEAGSQIILTNTFGANRLVLARHGLADKVKEINQAGVKISKAAAEAKAKVFAAVGPSGAMLMMWQSGAAELEDVFEEQTQALAEAGADGIVIETMSDLAETRLAVDAAKATGLPVVACMTFDSGKNKDCTMMGVTPEQAAEQLTAAGADAIGANCGQGVAGFVALCRRFRQTTALPIWIKANAGLPQMAEGKAVYTQTPEEFASFVPALREAGASFIGGCCGTTPEFIRALRAACGC